ncbi:MAG: caspase family protein [Neomegalonema sp.]|nr:caspase family protein [Neomegalonema sp.]
MVLLFRRVLAAQLIAMAMLVAGMSSDADADRALLVGVGHYPALMPNGQLNSPTYDAEAMRDFLIEEGWFAPGDITLLFDNQATKANVVEAIERELIAGTRPGDRVFFFFAGHGSQFPDEDGDEDDGLDETLLMHEANWQYGHLTDDEFGALLDQLEGRDVTVVIDACHSGTVTRGAAGEDGTQLRRRSVSFARERLADGTMRGTLQRAETLHPETLREISQFEPMLDREVWSAAAPDQYAWEDQYGGVFTRLFIEAHRSEQVDRNGNGQISNAEAQDFLRAEADIWCVRASECKAFTPIFEGDLTKLRPVRLGHDPAQSGSQTSLWNAPLSLDQRENSERDQSEPEAEPASFGSVFDRGDKGCSELAWGGGDVNSFSPSDLLGFVNDANLTIAPSRSGSIKVGMPFHIDVSTARTGTLLVLDVSADCHLRQLSPSVIAFPGFERVQAGDRITVPSVLGADGRALRLIAEEPRGHGQLIALLIEGDAPDLPTLFSQNMTGDPIANAAAHLRELARRMRTLRVNNGRNEALRWSVAYHDYHIE